MANSEIGTSTGNTSGSEYQVFLSFRGPDTRCGFTNCLYHALVDAGIRVFKDDEELRPGERISGNLLRAIDDSKLYIPIFSKNYASSHWCLHELAKMVENTSKSKEDGKKKVILPIFYDVIPDDVKLKTALYSDAILNLEQKMEDQKKFGPEDVGRWRQALKEVDGTKGWELEKYPGYGDLIKLVVNEVMVRLKTRQRDVTEHLVGMEDRIAAVNNLLDIDSGGVRLIGIYGMGGIGKTTLSKVIFNKLCPRFGKNCSFLDEVRERAKTKGLAELQEKLLSNISNSRVAHNIDNIDHGINMIGETINNKKVLIVLDDVDEGNQIQKLIGANCLCPGTRILVTTRDKSVLKIKGFKYEILPYEMEGLSQKDALQLFSWHAFNDSSPPPDYYTLSKDIVSTVDGLPLALQAIGSSLFDQKNKKIWEERLEKLRKTPYKDVLGKLRISYEALESDQQQIFLDVACFFIHENKTNPMYMWEDCGFGPENVIDVLIKRCMIKVLHVDGTHDNFAMHDQFRDLGRAIAKQEHTRLWDKDDIICELRSTEIKGSVQALCLPWRGWSQPPITVTSEQIKRFPRMRFLSLYDVICQGDCTGCLSQLKWINLSYPYNNNERLVARRLGWFERIDWWHLENVVVVILAGLDYTKDVFESLIKGARKLKVLSLHDNRSIHGTLTFPEYLVLEKLTIYGFYSLMEIDCSIGKLRWLTHLSIKVCLQLKKLPEQIGELQNLRHLSIRDCRNFIELPDTVSKLVRLTELDVAGTSITRLPDSIGRLSSLSSINVSSTPIEELPSTMSKLDHLQTLRLDNCNRIQELPELPRSLTTLRLTSSSLMTVPNLSYLTDLVELDLSDYSWELSQTEARPDIIQTCDLRWIGSLSKLNELRLWFCFLNVCAPTIELGSLSLLKELKLHGVDLPTLQHLPSNLIVLELLGKQELKEETAILPSSSRELRENKMLRQLQAPESIDHWRGAFIFPSSLKMLQRFRLSGFPELQDIQFVYTLGSLEEFSVEECSSLKSLGGLSNLKNLRELNIWSCPSLQVVEGINELEFLYWLEIEECGSMEMIFDASSSKIPNECEIYIECSGKLLDTDSFPCVVHWESYKEKILNGITDSETEIGEQASDSDVETTDSETETGDPPQKTVRLLSIHSSSLFLLLYLLSISALF